MSVALIVIYEGTAEDPKAFVEYYKTKHVPLIRSFPKIRQIEISPAIEKGDYLMFTRLTFDNLEDLHEALESPQREKTRADVKNFPPFKGTMRRAIVEILPM